mmetsp:Transcript_22307/g.47491  ORF Transcript_22307/g.47491 Transcript_22307/m.47491 type:complete len:358 (+) Transcript_22307:356-1429(+)
MGVSVSASLSSLPALRNMPCAASRNPTFPPAAAPFGVGRPNRELPATMARWALEATKARFSRPSGAKRASDFKATFLTFSSRSSRSAVTALMERYSPTRATCGSACKAARLTSGRLCIRSGITRAKTLESPLCTTWLIDWAASRHTSSSGSSKRKTRASAARLLPIGVTRTRAFKAKNRRCGFSCSIQALTAVTRCSSAAVAGVKASNWSASRVSSASSKSPLTKPMVNLLPPSTLLVRSSIALFFDSVVAPAPRPRCLKQAMAATATRSSSRGTICASATCASRLTPLSGCSNNAPIAAMTLLSFDCAIWASTLRATSLTSGRGSSKHVPLTAMMARSSPAGATVAKAFNASNLNP